mmetsp:Transcript_131796/g.229128  ORF Transcript_131796/g.229128 Transcript_131796/m.229128 type:complete len:242 (-) Transcript_131796:293-1018(-)
MLVLPPSNHSLKILPFLLSKFELTTLSHFVSQWNSSAMSPQKPSGSASERMCIALYSQMSLRLVVRDERNASGTSNFSASAAAGAGAGAAASSTAAGAGAASSTAAGSSSSPTSPISSAPKGGKGLPSGSNPFFSISITNAASSRRIVLTSFSMNQCGFFGSAGGILSSHSAASGPSSKESSADSAAVHKKGSRGSFEGLSLTPTFALRILLGQGRSTPNDLAALLPFFVRLSPLPISSAI